MKKLLTNLLFLALVLCGVLWSTAMVAQQGTENSGAVIRVSYGGNTRDFFNGACGYGTANWGGIPQGKVCAPAAWAYDITPDSLCCDSIPAGQLAGKVALIRRGVCGFSIKAFNAQKAGALAVLIANHYTDPAQNACSIMGMGATQPQAGQTTIPVFFMSRQMSEFVDAGLKSGQPVEICIIIPEVRMNRIFFPASSKRTPVSQIPVDTFEFAVWLTNTSGVNRTNVVLDAYVLTANDSVLYTAKRTVPTFDAGVTDSLFIIPGTYAPKLPIGTYKILYTANSDPVGGVTPAESKTQSNFYVSEKLFSKDDGATIGFRPGSLGDNWGVGAVYFTNPKATEKYRVKDIEFSFATNANEVPVTSVRADVYFFKIKDNVLSNLSNFDNTKFESESFEWLGTAPYEATQTTSNYADQKVELINLNTGNFGVEIQNGARYVPAVLYSGDFVRVFHAFDQDVPLPFPSTMVFNGQWFTGGFQGGPSAVLRMYLDLVTTTDEKPLPDNVMQVRPNPVVNGQLMLQMGFSQPTDATITIAEMSGRVITYEVRDGVTNDLLTYSLPQLASGTYLARVSTKEGTLTKKFVVQN
ncbi:MAG: T9SS type A sorting domain-containing protein [Saprospiraceae bacterium]|nr:T9SS type A sorting domain-containing protein [Saprospiraceae bacterium]MDW8228378.1 T9SS type A sorting domain-containing protein [Saprospiraceae bacterium]